MSRILFTIAVLALTGCQRAKYCVDSSGKRWPIDTIITTTTVSVYCADPSDTWKPLEVK